MDCYRAYHSNRRTLADAAYFSLTVLERAAGKRKNAATRFAIDEQVLRKIGELTGQKGGIDARKAKGTVAEFTPNERAWLEQSLKVMLRRCAEVANSSGPHRVIGMSDLPPL